MKTLIGMVAVVALGLALAGGGTGNNTSAQDDSRVEQGVQRIDSVLQKGLTPGTHDAVSEKARASADWLKSIEEHAFAGLAK